MSEANRSRERRLDFYMALTAAIAIGGVMTLLLGFAYYI